MTLVDEDDRGDFIRFFGTEEVMAIRKFGVLSKEQASATFDDMLDHWRHHGFGMYAVRERTAGTFMGECGLRFLEDGSDVEISYGLFPDYWGGGYGTEAATAVLDAGFNQLKLKRIVAHGSESNARSRRVMEKLGMRHIHTFDDRPHPVVKYLIERQ